MRIIKLCLFCKHNYKSGSLLRHTNEPTLTIRRHISPTGAGSLPDLGTATLGARLRYLRRRLGLTIALYATGTGVSHGAIGRLERDKLRTLNPWVLGRILPFLASKYKEAFPETAGDPYDFLVPPTTFGAWLRNQRMRRGLQQRDLARLLGVNRESIRRYEANETKPIAEVRNRLRKVFKLNGELERFL